ncbi:uncharacterized protein [Diadema antillarum]|uniref:uncharacterized protein n=1 Tax=Diadema antillarum TaxID=105358 RepID=UPI003A8AF343
MIRYVLLVEVLICLTFSQDAFCQRVVERPSHRTVREGGTVLFRCIITNLQPQQRIYWYRVSTRMYLTENRIVKNTEQRGRLSVLGNAGRGEYFLQITNTRVSDAGTYRCGYAIPTMIFTGFGAILTVLREPDQGFPMCEVSPRNLEIGDTAELICRSQGGIPPASLVWSANGRHLTGMVQTRNTLRLPVTADLNGLEHVCTATSEALLTPRRCSVILIAIRPDVRIEPPQRIVQEGRNAKFTCVAFGLPAIVRYNWTFNNEMVINIPRIEVSPDGRTLVIMDTRLADDNSVVQCTVTTTHGLTATSGASLRVVEAEIRPTTIATTLIVNATTAYFNNTITEGYPGKPPSVIIIVIVISVIVGQVLIIILVYILYRAANRMMKEKKNRQPPPPVGRQLDMEQNIYVSGRSHMPDIDPETGAPSIMSDATYQGQPVMYQPPGPTTEEPVYSATPETPSSPGYITADQVNLQERTSAGEDIPEYQGVPGSESVPVESLYLEVKDSPPVTPTTVIYDNDVVLIPQSASRPKSQLPPPLALLPPTPDPETPYDYSEFPFEEASSGVPVVITSSPPKSIPPRLPADLREAKPAALSDRAVPTDHAYYGLKPDRTTANSKYLSLHHYDKVAVEGALKEGARLENDTYDPEKNEGKEHDDDGYVYECPPTMSSPDEIYDIPPDADRYSYTFMGGKAP